MDNQSQDLQQDFRVSCAWCNWQTLAGSASAQGWPCQAFQWPPCAAGEVMGAEWDIMRYLFCQIDCIAFLQSWSFNPYQSFFASWSWVMLIILINGYILKSPSSLDRRMVKVWARWCQTQVWQQLQKYAAISLRVTCESNTCVFQRWNCSFSRFLQCFNRGC